MSAAEETTVAEELTLEEQEKILTLAEGYIREPESWVCGTWKCPLYRGTGSGITQAQGPNGEPLYQYCVEGAVNQATVDVVGEERAITLGVGRMDPGTAMPVRMPDGTLDLTSAEDELNPTRRLGLDTLAFDLWREEGDWETFSPHRSYAMEYNDSPEDSEDSGEELEEARRRVHQGLLKLLSTARSRVRDLMKEEAR